MLTEQQVERILKDANFVGPQHPYAPQLFDDLCCHIRALVNDRADALALAEAFKIQWTNADHEREALLKRLVKMRYAINCLHDATIVLRNGIYALNADYPKSILNEAVRLIEEAKDRENEPV